MIVRIIDQINWISLASLVVVTPVLFTTATSELFEVPKMLFVYFVAAILTTATLAKFMIVKKITVPKNFILISLILILLVYIASTIASIDKFTSVFGYPSRLNGGLLSQIAYILIFVCAIVNLNRLNSPKIFLVAIVTAAAVSLWGIPGYFGRDPNCLVLTGSLNASCWQQEFDPTKRIFSTLGQPNWLASYLVIVLPLALSQIFATKVQKRRILFSLTTLIIFIALMLTNSRAGLAGATSALFVFFFLIGARQIRKNLKIFLAILVPIIIIVIIAGSTLFARIYEAVSFKSQPQGGTESGQIRLIVWQGAIEIFRHNPILGTGPETFAYSYYKYRPPAHNLTTEWNFFYNKAHNEFLNYLANLGILGFGAYLSFLLTTIFTLWRANTTLAKSVMSALVGYQTTIFFGFSTVATQTLMFLMVAAALVTLAPKTWQINLKLPTFGRLIIGLVIVLMGIATLASIARLFLADVLVNRASYSLAISTHPTENPFYLADAAYATALSDSAHNFFYSGSLAQKAEILAPNNLIVLRKVANAYFLISQSDKNYEDDAIRVAQRLTQLAPTDPQSYLAAAKIQIGLDKIDDAQKTLATALQLKPDYVEAQQILEQLTTNN